MGQAASNANNRPSNVQHRRIDSPARRSSQSPAATSSPSPHRSLRTKKKSLELPDLASLATNPSPTQNYPYSGLHSSTPRTSSPIPIPISPNVNTSSPRRQHNFPSTQQLPHVLVEPPSTHIPINPKRKGNPFFRSAPLQYNSTRSFTSKSQQPHPPSRMQEPAATPPPPFIPETVHSTIPIALEKAESASVQAMASKRQHSADDPHDPISVKITWRGGGKSVILARAGDDNWKGRTVMEREIPTSDQTWSTWVSLAPGTHHFRFLVDGHWRLADDLPAAVDDEGSLANYVAVALYTPPSTSTIPASSPAMPRPQPGQSFWSTSSTDGPSGSSSDDRRSGPPRWTSEFPPELLAAAREEENYLASSSSLPDSASSGVPAPNIPPAPTLPRHLDKLILNVRLTPNGPAQTGRTRDRDKEREERRAGKKSGRSVLGMTSTEEGVESHFSSASRADASSAVSRAKLDAPGLADDASVLPVPSHVVLQHLSTSAIRNGVLAVGNTTRYRKKYLTTIYYKPT